MSHQPELSGGAKAHTMTTRSVSKTQPGGLISGNPESGVATQVPNTLTIGTAGGSTVTPPPYSPLTARDDNSDRTTRLSSTGIFEQGDTAGSVTQHQYFI